MLKKHLINTLITFLFFSNIFAQFSERDINRLNNSQLDSLKDALQSTQESDDSVLPENKITTEIDKISIEPLDLQKEKLDEEDSEYFGYNYFKKNINFFDNIPTPSDFKLGPGDEIILSLWGETNLRESFTINKDGAIYYSDIGFINLSNKNIGIICGGWSDERLVSLDSGKTAFKSLLCNDIKVSLLDFHIDDISILANFVEAKKIDIIFNLIHGEGGEDGLVQNYLEKIGVKYVGSNAESSKLSFNKILTKEIWITLMI